MVLVDTDVTSFLFRNDPRAERYASLLKGEKLAISVVTLAEIQYGMTLRDWGRDKRELMDRYLGKYTVISATAHTAAMWADICSSRRRLGRPIGYSDAWIAATALQFNLPLATNNGKDFQSIAGLKLVSTS